MVKKLLLIFAVIVVTLVLFNSLIMPWYVKHSDLAKVPNVTGMNFLDAKKIIEEAGLEIKQGDVKYDESKPLGQILDQNPPFEQTVKQGRRVYVTVCGGEQLVEVPALTGRSIRDAKFALEQRSLNLGETVKKFSSDYPEDVVISQVIQPGSKVKKTTKVDLIVSNGPLLGDIIIPDLVGKNLEEAKKIINEKKLKLGKVTYQASDNTPGQVVDQYPKKDKSAKQNTDVDLFVAKKKKSDENLLEGEVSNPKEDIQVKKKETADKPKIDDTEKPDKIKQTPPVNKETIKEPVKDKEKKIEKKTDKDREKKNGKDTK